MKQELLALVRSEAPFVPEGLGHVTCGEWSALLRSPVRRRRIAGPTRRDRLKDAAMRQSKLESLMCNGTVLPVAPDCLVDAEELALLVSANRETLARAAGVLEGRHQYQISVTWDESRVLERFADSPELFPLTTAGRVSPHSLQSACSALAGRIKADIEERLRRISADLVCLPLTPGMVANLVLLCDARADPDLDVALEEIDSLWPEGFRIRQIGPAPGASFATLVFRQTTLSEVRQALRRFDLRGDWTIADLKSARKTALRRTPEQTNTIHAQAHLLSAYSAAGRPTGPFCLADVWSEHASTHIIFGKAA